jgi:hypothetical protein
MNRQQQERMIDIDALLDRIWARRRAQEAQC